MVAAVAGVAANFRLALEIAAVNAFSHCDHLTCRPLFFFIILVRRPLRLRHMAEIALHAQGRAEITHRRNHLVSRNSLE